MINDNYKNSEIEIEHIKLELLNNRSEHLRHFVDQYYCYKNNYVNSKGRPVWNKIYWSGIVSVKASLTKDKKEVVKEHVVPLKLITDLLIKHSKESEINSIQIKSILDKYLIFATITKKEDADLREKKLTSKMPSGFYDKDDYLYGDLFARYKVAKIELKKND
jgi:hypothetical protein